MKIKKNLTLISLMLGVMLLVTTMGMVSAATTVTFHPQAGVDSSNGDTTLTTSDLNKVAASDNNRYSSKEDWEGSYNENDYIDFKNFNINLPSGAVVSSVNLKFEWQREKDVEAARIKIWDASSSSWTSPYDLSMPIKDTDQTETIDMTSFITTSSDLSNFKVRFQAHNHDCGWGCDPKKKTKHDLVEIEITYTLPQQCEVIVDEPIAGHFYDPVTIRWHYSGTCGPFDYNLKYQVGSCDGDAWVNIANDIDPNSGNNNVYSWDVTSISSGVYCIGANMDRQNGPDVTGYSGLFYLDLNPPVVHMSVGTPQDGDCSEGTGDCYVNKDTDLTLTCTDDDPVALWQSEGPYIIKYKINGGSEQTYSTPFSFGQDSNHVLEYWCSDEVGKVSAHKTKNFFVDTAVPIFNEKQVSDPKASGCDVEHPSQHNCDWYVTQATQICLSAYDPEPHPVEGVQISCMATVWETLGSNPVNVQILLDGQGCFTYNEDSYHELHCTATDALGNTADLYEADIVDTVEPETGISFSGPYYADQFSQWIDSVSRIILTAVDPEPHPVDDVTTYYRYEQVSDSYCEHPELVQWEPTPKDDESWMEYEEPFGLPESCYVVEYYSEDALENSEDVNHRFVFSDHTDPKTIKEVGNPSHDCNSLLGGLYCEDNWDWLIPMETEITISCQDQLPHPSGEKQICYRITLDGDVIAREYPAYEGEGIFNEEGYWCVNYNEPISFAFEEESEHQLEFYCVDNVDKVSDVDSEIFKVQGNSFKLELDKKWNLISIPFNLNVNDIDTIFGDDADKIEGIWTYENGVWKSYIPDGPQDFTEMFPGRGYWVKTTAPVDFEIDGALIKQGPYTPPSVAVTSGWNLIGHYGLQDKPVACSLYTLTGNWESLVGFDSSTQHLIGDDEAEPTETVPGQGYWLGMDANDLYMPHSC